MRSLSGRARSQSTLTAADWNASAAPYHSVESTTGRYARIADAMIGLADVRPGMHIVDAACGTGTVTERLICRIGAGRLTVTAIDCSAEMLEIASHRLPSGAARFKLATAATMDQVVADPVDRVFCNAAFWQMDMRRVLHAVRRLLTAEGYFIVSSPDPLPDRQTSPYFLYGRSKLAWMLIEARESIGQPLEDEPSQPRISQADIVVGHAEACGFRVVRSEALHVDSPVASTLEFLRIPAFLRTSPLLRGLSGHDREQVVRIVTAQLRHVEATVAPKRWRVIVLAPLLPRELPE